jgi:hypothetical protein
MLMYLHLTPSTSDQPIDFMADMDEYVCEFNIDESELMETLDDSILNSYRAIWS